MKQKIERLRSLLGGTKVNGVCLTDLLSHIDALEARVEEAETIAGIATIPDVAGMAERLEAAERALAEAVEVLRVIEGASANTLAALDAYNEKHETFPGGPHVFRLGKAIAAARAFLTKRGEK